MKLKTSFFNGSVLGKDITRFAPVWALYTIFQLMTVLLIGEDCGSAERFAADAPGILMSMGILNALYAGLCAMLLFGDLFQSRMCNALHAMPLRREGWFLTHTVAGFLFCMMPNLLGCLLASVLLEEYFYLAAIWLAVMALQSLFYFGVGAFSALCAGNRLGMMAVYGIFNFLAVLAAWLAKTFYEPFLPGVRLNLHRWAQWSPVVGFTDSSYVDVRYDKIMGVQMEGFRSQEWQYLFIAAGVGLVLLIAAALLYRKRDLESAGDMIAVKAVAPVFLVIYTLGTGAVMYYVADMFSGQFQYGFMGLGMLIGFFTGRMLLEKRVNVFRLKNILGFAALAVVFLASIGITWLDPVGITRYVPETAQVQEVTIDNNQDAVTLTKHADVEKILEVHRLQVRTSEDNADMALTLRYKMKDGTYLERHYRMNADTKSGQILRPYFSSPECVLGTADTQSLTARLTRVECYSHWEGGPVILITSTEAAAAQWEDKYWDDSAIEIPVGNDFSKSEAVQGLMEAILADCRDGNLARHSAFHPMQAHMGYMVFEVRGQNGFIGYQDFPIWEDCTHILSYITELAEKYE